jgi:hypothetical protein
LKRSAAVITQYKSRLQDLSRGPGLGAFGPQVVRCSKTAPAHVAPGGTNCCLLSRQFEERYYR